MKKALLLGLIGLMSVMGVRAGVIDSVDVRLRIGYNFGGTSPLSLPASIRSIDAFRPTFSPCIGAEMTIPVVRGQWSVVGGIRLGIRAVDEAVTAFLAEHHRFFDRVFLFGVLLVFIGDSGAE